VFLHFFLTRERANVPKYIFKHLIKNLKDSQTIQKNFVPYGRLLSEIFHQGGILKALKEVNYFTDAQLGTVKGRIINGATLVSMKFIKKADYKELSTDLKESSVISNLMDDFPPICKQDPLEVRVMFIKEYFEMTGQVIKISDIPDEMYGGALPIAKNRKSLKRKMTEAEYLDVSPKSAAKNAKTAVPQDNPSVSDMLLEDSEATEQVDPEHIIEITSGTSSSSVSSDSSEVDEPTQSLIDELNKRSTARSVPQKTDSVNQTNSTSSSVYPIPLKMILPEPVAETVVPASVQVTASEPSATVTVPSHTITNTPEKATTSASEKTDVANQQQSEPIKQTTPELTSTSTHIKQTQTTNSPQKAIPEPVVETVVPESRQVTESEPSVTITASEAI